MACRLLHVVFALLFATSVVAASEFDLTKLSITRELTEEGTIEVQYFYNGAHVSPWHDIPIREFIEEDQDDKIVNFVCEIPKGTTAKNEIHKSAPFNPVLQDRKNDKPRFYKYGDSIVNYGAIPQTWEDPNFISEETGFGGDNDPIDVLQINNRPCEVGEVMQVRILGCLALVDDDETDWKIIVSEVKDQSLSHYRDIEHVPVEKVNAMREWFRLYKTAEGKGPNNFGLDERAMGSDYAVKVVKEAYDSWAKIKDSKCDFDGTPCWIKPEAKDEL